MEHMQCRFEDGSSHIVAGRPCPTNKTVSFFAFVGNGVVAEKGVINIMNVHCYLAYGESYAYP